MRSLGAALCRGAATLALGTRLAIAASAQDAPLRVLVSLDERRLRVVAAGDTLLSATVAVGSGDRLTYGAERWTFETPRGTRIVLRKDSLPVWVPPDWHYHEAARAHGLVVKRLPVSGVTLGDGRRLEVRRDTAGMVDRAGTFTALPVDEEIVVDGVLFIPPLGSANRRIAGELGRYRLDLGDGLSIHGTPHLESLGRAATHGCIRVGDDDIEWLYRFVPVGTPVTIY